MNEQTKKKLEPLRGTSVKEIVAHSWGTEIVYSAIQEGLIIPPKRLFVLGSPGKSDARWRLLAERTGTIVIFVGDERDSVTNWGDALRENRYALRQEKLWQEACGQRDCNPYQRTGEIHPLAISGGGLGNHARKDYYDGIRNFPYALPGGPVQKTTGEMRVDDGEALKAASAEIFSSGLAEARERIIDSARAMARKKEESERAREQDDAINRLLADLAAKYCGNPERVD